MINRYLSLGSERGFTLITAMLMLFAATILGIIVMNSSRIEIMLSGAQQRYENNLNIAEAGWVHGAYWLNDFTTPPARVNTDINDPTNAAFSLVRNYGGGFSGALNNNFPSGTADGSPTDQNVAYWFKVDYRSNKKVAGSSGNMFRDFTYLVTSSVGGRQAIEVNVQKTFKVGY